MANLDEFKITNPNAPFIKLIEITSNLDIPFEKCGDVRWLNNNINLIKCKNKNVLKDLISDLLFIKKDE